MRFVNQLTGQVQEAEPWQMELQPGDHYVNQAPVGGIIDSAGPRLFDGFPVIYGQILRPTREPGFFWVRAYSAWEPDGEEGLMCIVDATRKLTAQEFEDARRNNWP